jgi:hypothetical protein
MNKVGTSHTARQPIADTGYPSTSGFRMRNQTDETSVPRGDSGWWKKVVHPKGSRARRLELRGRGSAIFDTRPQKIYNDPDSYNGGHSDRLFANDVR